ncbi:hypothetical protein B9Z19DRAFT_1065980 [Tuber borchii]|uniref:Uncharacterized protein n=1 Tax=Tuber borchii TaxID=42251 RepID=A0A2T6ZP30_TUBBO|nr:hypothetical protein B9Z19DRAFT_1065980 [Tuber borchii]
MDIFTNPANNTYVTGITNFFLMPTDSGGIPAVAVSKKASGYINSAYTFLTILIFMTGWDLILAITMAFWHTSGEHSQTPLAALWDSGESMSATMLLGSYCKRVTLGNPREGSMKWKSTDLTWGLPFVFIALVMTLGNAAAGVVVPPQLAMGNVVPPAKDVIFYPDVAHLNRTDDGRAGIAILESLKAPSALLALVTIEVSEATVRKRVHIESGINGDSANVDYDYNVTGVDMGLQNDPKLKLMVKGSCRTDDTWLLNSTDQGDTYRLFGGNDTFEVKYQPEVGLPPMVNFQINRNTGGGSNVSYAMIANTGGLYSYTSGQDPWYATDRAGANGSAAFRVRRKRPALSCWEAKTWHLNGKDVDGSNLATLPGLKLPPLWKDTVFPFEFGDPRVVSVGNAAGLFALKSASYAVAPSFILDAGASGIRDDFERLVLASWVSSRNVLRDTTTYKPLEGMKNVAKGPGGSVEAASAKFVLPSGDVVTLSVRVLISVPAILLFLFIVQQSLSRVLPHSESGLNASSSAENNNDKKLGG